MKILFLTPWYPDEKNPNHGIFVRDQAVALSKQHQVLVIAAKIDYSDFAFSSVRVTSNVFHNVQEIRIIVKRSLPVYNQVNYFLRVLFLVAREGKQLQPDIIHANIGYPGAFLGWAAGKILDVPFVVTEHTRLINNFRSFFHKWLTLFSLRRAKSLMAVSKWHADEIVQLASVQASVVHNVVDFSKFPDVIQPPQGINHIGFLGSLNTPVKGLDLLLKACAELTEDFTLHIGGGGVLVEQYRTLAEQLGIAGRCKFYGIVPHKQVPEFMKRLHFFVNTSRWETFGIAMVEALASGLPVVATESGGPADFITSENGMMVEANVVSIAAGIRRMMTTYQAYDPQKVRDSVIEKFSERTFLNAVNSIYANVVVAERAP